MNKIVLNEITINYYHHHSGALNHICSENQQNNRLSSEILKNAVVLLVFDEISIWNQEKSSCSSAFKKKNKFATNSADCSIDIYNILYN